MIEITIMLRMLFLLKQNCHNMVSKISFLSDHDFLGSSYEMSLAHYDSMVERMIGLGFVPDLITVQINAVNKLKDIQLSYKENVECFNAILQVNKIILQMIEKICKSNQLSQGVLQLLGGIADDIEKECYKLVQRTKGK